MLKEYGGYLPIEFPEREEYYEQYDASLIRLNSGRSAIRAALEVMRPTRVYTPYYLCESVLDVYSRMGLPYQFYHIDESFLPTDTALLPDEAILWTNYFGVAPEKIRRSAVTRYGKQLLIDNTQAFFSAPVMECFNVYSCRKFFGAADGAYLIGNAVDTARQYPSTHSHERYFHLLKSMECGTNAAYQGHLENERTLGNETGSMSVLTRRILRSLDYESIQKKRIENFAVLHEMLGECNLLTLGGQTISPMVYPLLIDNPLLRQTLIDRRIYVPQWWKHVSSYADANWLEKKLSEYLLPLPIDQRYNIEDMKFIAEHVLKFIKK